MIRPLRIGTRGSKLALAQAELFVQALRGGHPGIETEVRIFRTEGDRDARSPLSRIGGQGVFVRELERALLAGEIDVAVHSLKDVPVELLEGLELAAFLKRQDPRDALVARDGAALSELPAGARVGTGSVRRSVQVASIRPDLRFEEIRGNVDTRVRRVAEGAFDGVILAVAGLMRLGLLDEATEVFDPDVVTPAPGQGVIAIEAREDGEVLDLLAAVDDRGTRTAAEAERAFLRTLGGGCSLPAGCLAEAQGDSVRVRAFLASENGERASRVGFSGRAADAESLGRAAGEQLLDALEGDAARGRAQ